MRGLSKVINEKDPAIDSFCIGNTLRPLLSYGPKGVRGGRRTFLFVEALRKFEEEAKLIDLTEAYKKAKPMYNGRLEHTFVVLKEEKGGEVIISGANSEPVGVKRPAQDGEMTSSKRKPTAN